MTVKNLISVIIPAYDAALFIKDAIESVLAQQYRPVEVIVVDDGSNDSTASIAESFGAPVICHRQDNGGPPVARNSGLAVAKGEYIGFLDADDLYEPERIQLQLGKLRHNPDVEVVIGRLMREELTSEPDAPMAFKPVDTGDQISLQLGVCLFRRSAFERVGPMDKFLQYSDDWDWFMRARELGLPMVLHEEIVLRQRLHRNNLTRNRAANLHFLPVMLKRSLERRRDQAGRAQSLPDLVLYHEKIRQKNEE